MKEPIGIHSKWMFGMLRPAGCAMLGFVVLALWARGDQVPPLGPPVIARLVSEKKDSPARYALEIQAVPGGPARAVDVAMLIDASASVGPKRLDLCRQIVTKIIESLVGGSRVWIRPMPSASARGNRPAAVGSDELARAMAQLEQRPPLGIGDFTVAIGEVESWLADASGDLPKVIVAIGTNRTLDLPATVPLATWNERWKRTKARWIVVPLERMERSSPVVRWADGTGGGMLPVSKAVSHSTVMLGEILAQPAIWIDRVHAGPPIVTMSPPSRPYVSGLRGAVVEGQWHPSDKLSVRIDGRYGDQPFQCNSPVALVQSDMVFPSAALDQWLREPATMPPLSSLEELAELGRRERSRLEGISPDKARAALVEGRLDAALAMYRDRIARDADDAEARAGLGAVARLRDSQGTSARKSPNDTGRRGVYQGPRTPAREEVAEPPPTPKASTEPPTDPIEEAKARDRVLAQRLTMVVSETLKRADKLARTDPESAIQLLKQALLTVESATEQHPESAAGLKRRIEQQLRSTWRARRRTELERMERDRLAAVVDGRARSERSGIARQLTTDELLDRFNQLLRDGHYQEAMPLANQAVVVDPDNPAANGATWLGAFTDRFARTERNERARSDGWWQALFEAEAAAIPEPDSGIITYPPAKVWEELSIRRAKYKESVDLSPPSPAEEEIRRALPKPITLDFHEAPLSDVVEFIRAFASVNVVVDQVGLQEANVDPDVPVTLRLEGVPLKSALRLLLDPLDLTYSIRNDVLLITSRVSAEQRLITKVYPVGDLVIPIQNIGLAGGAGFGGGLGGGGGIGGRGGTAGGGGLGGFGGAARANAVAVEKDEPVPPDAPPRPEAKSRWLPLLEKGLAAPKVWDEHFRQFRESDSSLREAVGLLFDRREYDAIAAFLLAAGRHQRLPSWCYEAIALAITLAGGDPETARQGLCSLVDQDPRNLEVTLRVALALAAIGQPAAALVLLDAAEERFPGSLNTRFLSLFIADSAGDIDRVVRAGSELLSGCWGRDHERVVRETTALLRQRARALRAAGKGAPADRVTAILAAPIVRDLEITLHWQGEADVDLAVIEPGNLLCSAVTPRTIHGGVLCFDDLASTERYVATQAPTGDYELLIRRAWGAPAGGIVTVDIVRHAGTDHETRERRTVDLKESASLRIHLDNGRRNAPTLALSAEPLWIRLDQEPARKVPPSARLRELTGKATGASDRPLEQARGGPEVAVGSFGSVAFNPIIATVASGPSLVAQAVVSPDRRFVRITALPVFQQVIGEKPVPITGAAGSGLPAAR